MSSGSSPIPTIDIGGWRGGLALSQPTLHYLWKIVEAPLMVTEFLVVFVVMRLAVPRLWLADLLAAAVLSAADILAGGGYRGAPSLLLFTGAMVMIPTLTGIALIRRFGLLAFIVYVAFLRAAAQTSLGTSGWLFERTIYSHLLLPAVAIWALWVLLTDPRQQSTESSA
jgi:hypothetical protein